jgi:hypothetical protein
LNSCRREGGNPILGLVLDKRTGEKEKYLSEFPCGKPTRIPDEDEKSILLPCLFSVFFFVSLAVSGV